MPSSKRSSTTQRNFKKLYAGRKIRRCAKGSDHSDKFDIQENLSKLTTIATTMPHIDKDVIPPLQAQSFRKEEETLDDQAAQSQIHHLSH
ncbi:unnamed protein product [Arabidopsis lyrata]|nr:unnamed protein product [Arabidopsis lyrata]